MLGFPTPYPNELVYSVIARAGVHEGETSPKQLLDSVFANKKVIATVDLPCHVGRIADQYPKSLSLSALDLVEKHTLWPIYAPFLPNDRRKAIEEWMLDRSQGAAHLASGIVASRVPAKRVMLICHCCAKRYEQDYGETFWDRRWQSPVVDCCPIHGALSETDIRKNGEHRHAYVPVSQCKIVGSHPETESGMRFSELVYQLFDSYVTSSPSYQQWTSFYRNLAFANNFLNGKRIDHELIRSQLISYWDKDWLKKKNLLPSKSDTSWLRSIFRKHRKAFSFAEHITAIGALSQGHMSIVQALESALDINETYEKKKVKIKVKSNKSTVDQNKWLSLLLEDGPKGARNAEPALYARLYRNNHDWLIDVDKKHQLPPVSVNRRVEWSARDRVAARALLNFVRMVESDLSLPRLTQTFFIHQLNNSATIEKNLCRLPRCAAILKRYTESVDEYQIRRLTRVYISFIESNTMVKKWVLLREAGLSEVRMSKVVRKFLGAIVRDGKQGKI